MDFLYLVVSNKDGVVELYPFLDTMKRIKTELNMFVSCHVGLVDKKLADGLKKANVDAVLLDIIGDDQTIREVYKLLHKSVRDYEESLKPLKEAGHNIVPHTYNSRTSLRSNKGRIQSHRHDSPV